MNSPHLSPPIAVSKTTTNDELTTVYAICKTSELQLSPNLTNSIVKATAPEKLAKLDNVVNELSPDFRKQFTLGDTAPGETTTLVFSMLPHSFDRFMHWATQPAITSPSTPKWVFVATVDALNWSQFVDFHNQETSLGERNMQINIDVSSGHSKYNDQGLEFRISGYTTDSHYMSELKLRNNSTLAMFQGAVVAVFYAFSAPFYLWLAEKLIDLDGSFECVIEMIALFWPFLIASWVVFQLSKPFIRFATSSFTM